MLTIFEKEKHILVQYLKKDKDYLKVDAYRNNGHVVYTFYYPSSYYLCEGMDLSEELHTTSFEEANTLFIERQIKVFGKVYKKELVTNNIKLI